MNRKILLGVNIDHVATLRQVRGTTYPDPVQMATLVTLAGADSITVHLREDRRHIQDRDVRLLKETLSIPMNLEMAVTEEMIAFAETIKPKYVCLVPEKREELTTEGGLDVISNQAAIQQACDRLAKAGIKVSLFIDADQHQIDATIACGAPTIEIHTGAYADAITAELQQDELLRIINAVVYADKKGLIVNAGHGLTLENTAAIAQIPQINELNIGHSIVAHAVFVGMERAVREMKQLLNTGVTK